MWPSLHLLQRAWGKANDRWLGINTDDHVTPSTTADASRTLHNDGVCYQAADYRNLRRIVRILQPSPEDVVYDLGCGKGRCVCVFARQTVRRVVGVEYDPELCAVAHRNASLLRGRHSPIEIRCADAAVTDLAEGTIYFLYNPFGAETMKVVFEQIHDSLTRAPRVIRVVYYNAVWEGILATCPWLDRVTEFKTFTNRRVSFWSNQSGPVQDG